MVETECFICGSKENLTLIGLHSKISGKDFQKIFCKNCIETIIEKQRINRGW